MAESKFIDPGFYCCPSPIRSNQSDWHIQCFIQMLTKEEAHSAEIFVSFRRTNFPLSLNTFYRILRRCFRYLEKTNLLIFQSFCDIPGITNRIAHNIFHIGLAGTQPCFTHQNIFYFPFQFVFPTVKTNTMRSCSFRSTYISFPSAMHIRLYMYRICGGPTAYNLQVPYTGTPAPKLHFRIPLHHRMITNDRWKSKFRILC